jgi:hypothetical protein
VVATRIYTWTGVNWTVSIPTEGTTVRDETLNTVLMFTGAAWGNVAAAVDHATLLNDPMDEFTSLTRDADNAVAGAATYVIAWEAEVFGAPAAFWAVGAPTNIVIPTTGRYLVTLTVTLTDTGAGVNAILVRLLVGGAAVKIAEVETNANATETVTIATILNLTAADILTANVTPAANATVEGCTGTVGATTIEVLRVGP